MALSTQEKALCNAYWDAVEQHGEDSDEAYAALVAWTNACYRDDVTYPDFPAKPPLPDGRTAPEAARQRIARNNSDKYSF